MKWALEMYSSTVMLKKKSLNSLCKPFLGIVMWKKPIFVKQYYTINFIIMLISPTWVSRWVGSFFCEVAILAWISELPLCQRKLFSMLHRVAGRVINVNVVDCSHNLDTDQDYNYCTIFFKKRKEIENAGASRCPESSKLERSSRGSSFNSMWEPGRLSENWWFLYLYFN